MTTISINPKIALMLASAAILVPSSVSAQQGMTEAEREAIIVSGQQAQEAAMAEAPATEGPEIEGLITARSGNSLQVTAADGTSTVVNFNEATEIRASKGFLGLGSKTLGGDSLLNGLPVKVETMQAGGALIASKIKLDNSDLETANMIHSGTAQGFAEQTAATEALRGRVGDIDQYNIKGTTNVHFDTGKAVLSEQGKSDLCAIANQADAIDNALLLVVGYTDSVGDYEFNQQLSEKRANRVVNYLQQNCSWKPYRMLTPTGMAEADPLDSNDTASGKAQNRRVAVNIMVSKSVEGL